MYQKRVEALINLDNIKHNYRVITKKAGRVICVVKADAYGHGAAEVCRALSEESAEIFAVACIEEAIALRESGIKGDILILGITPPSEAQRLHEYDFIQTVASPTYIAALASHGYPQRVHIKVDTGMSRLGIYCHKSEDIPIVAEQIAEIYKLKNLKIEGIFTHFACADDISSPMTQNQYALFVSLCKACESKGLPLGIKHCCNSGGIQNYPDMYMDAVRAGLLLYGLSPCQKSDLTLKPAMQLVCRIAQVKHICKGDTVSYTAGFMAPNDMKTAVISIGYADGLSRLLSNKASVYISGKPAKLIGNICMDLCVADVTHIDCKEGDLVEVFGINQSVDTIAQMMGTVNYEIICSVKNRVPRKYQEQ